jgi:hypothetical protein
VPVPGRLTDRKIKELNMVSSIGSATTSGAGNSSSNSAQIAVLERQLAKYEQELKQQSASANSASTQLLNSQIASTEAQIAQLANANSGNSAAATSGSTQSPAAVTGSTLSTSGSSQATSVSATSNATDTASATTVKAKNNLKGNVIDDSA